MRCYPRWYFYRSHCLVTKWEADTRSCCCCLKAMGSVSWVARKKSSVDILEISASSASDACKDRKCCDSRRLSLDLVQNDKLVGTHEGVASPKMDNDHFLSLVEEDADHSNNCKKVNKIIEKIKIKL